MTRLTKQGVRDLNPIGANQKQHVHRYAPVTYTNREQRQVTQMKCFCGDFRQETDAEKRAREDAEDLAREDREYGRQYGWGQR